MNRKKRRVAGAIAIEAVLSLTVFMLAILALLMGSMLMHAQAQMQYALNQTAKEISGYFYLLDKFGVASALSQKTTDTAAANVQQLNDSIGHIVSFAGEIKNDAGQIEQEATETIENAKAGTLTDEDIARLKSIGADEKEKIEAEVETIKDDIQLLKKADKKEMFKGVLQVFSRALINTAFSEYVTPLVCEVLVPKYLTQGDEDTYFNALGIDPTSISFKGSQMLGDGRTINLVVTYTVDASKLTLGFYKKELHFRHVASTCAWVRENSSGSLVSLSTVDDYFDPEYMAQRAEELAKIREEQEAEKAAREEAEKNLRDEFDELNSSIHSEESSEMDHGIEPLEEEDETVDDEAVKEFIEKYPQGKALYEKYGAAVITAVNNCSDPNTAITLLLNAEKGNPAYGEEAVQALKKGGDDAVAALNLVPTKNCAVAITRCKDSSAAEAIVAVGKDRANEAVDAIIKGEDPQGVADAIKDLKGDALDAFKKVGTTKTVTDVLKDGGFAAAYAFTLYGEDVVKVIENSKSTPKAVVELIAEYDEAALVPLKNGYPLDQIKGIMEEYETPGGNLLKNGVTPDQIETLAAHGLTPDYFNNPKNPHTNRYCRNEEEAEYLLNQYNEIHEQFSDEVIKNLEERTMAQTEIWKNNWKKEDLESRANGKTKDEIGPAVAGVLWKGHEEPFFGTNALRPSEFEAANKNKPKELRQIQHVDPKRLEKDMAPIPDPCDQRVKAAIESIPDDGIYADYEDHTKGAGSHAEIYAVNEALLAGANPEDLLVYVNRVKKGKSDKYDPMETCPHCAAILKELGVKVLSNVEVHE